MLDDSYYICLFFCHTTLFFNVQGALSNRTLLTCKDLVFTTFSVGLEPWSEVTPDKCPTVCRVGRYSYHNILISAPIMPHIDSEIIGKWFVSNSNRKGILYFAGIFVLSDPMTPGEARSETMRHKVRGHPKGHSEGHPSCGWQEEELQCVSPECPSQVH